MPITGCKLSLAKFAIRTHRSWRWSSTCLVHMPIGESDLLVGSQSPTPLVPPPWSRPVEAERWSTARGSDADHGAPCVCLRLLRLRNKPVCATP